MNDIVVSWFDDRGGPPYETGGASAVWLRQYDRLQLEPIAGFDMRNFGNAQAAAEAREYPAFYAQVSVSAAGEKRVSIGFGQYADASKLYQALLSMPDGKLVRVKTTTGPPRPSGPQRFTLTWEVSDRASEQQG